jgi:Rrf2 family protein
MFQLSKRVEYGLIAIRHMASGGGGKMFTAKEIADAYHLPYELLAKVMQKLVKEGFISSFQGTHGGYVLLRNPSDIKVSEVINAIEGKQKVTVVSCEVEGAEDCLIHSSCTIKDPLVKLQENINKVLGELSITQMI